MTSKFSRAALIAGIAIGASGLVAVPAEAAGPSAIYVTQPSVASASNITPESATLSGVIDTGGDPGLTTSGASTSNPLSIGGPAIGPITSSAAQVNGIPVNDGYFSTVVFGADPLSDYTANGDTPGSDAVYSDTDDINTSTGLSPVSLKVGGTQSSGTSLTPGTKYVYWIAQQAGETNNATVLNAYNPSAFSTWLHAVAGTELTGANGSFTGGDYLDWLSGVNGYGSAPYTIEASSTAGDVGKTGTGLGVGAASSGAVSATWENPDWSCTVTAQDPASIADGAAALSATQKAEISTNQDPIPTQAAFSVPNGGPVATDGLSATTPVANGALDLETSSQPGVQGPCQGFIGGGANNFYDSQVGTFTTPKLGSVKFSRAVLAKGGKIKLAVHDASVVKASGQVQLKLGRKTVASGRFSALANGTSIATLKLMKAGTKAADAHKRAKVVLLVSNNDQPTGTKSIKL